MSPYIIAILIALAIHYFLAIATIYILMKDKGIVKAIIPWNILVLLLPIIGPLIYLIYRQQSKKH